jgi:ATP-binding cassette subfamily F protein 2
LVFADRVLLVRCALLLLLVPAVEAIDSLADAINRYNGGLVLVSHDFRLIEQVAKEIWLCEDKTVKPWKGSIRDYKAHLAKRMGLNKK